VLAEGGSHGEILEITGPAAVTDADIAAALSEATGRHVHHEQVDDTHIVAALLANSISTPFAQPLGADGIARRNGWFDMTTHAVPRLTGRPATSIVDYFTRQRAELLTV
jgi:NAD(P)H dehydrogenase (quinone)